MALFVKEFPRDLQRELKIMAMKEGIAFYKLIIRILEEYVDKAENS